MKHAAAPTSHCDPACTTAPAVHALRITLADGRVRLDRVPPSIPTGQCQVWRWRMVDNTDILAACHDLLSAQERQRADSFLVQPARRVFIQVRALLRLVLGEHLGEDPRGIRFDYGRYQKPALADDGSDTHFNVAHSGDYALIAIARGTEVGVDIEHMRHKNNLPGLAAQILSASETQHWEGLDDETRFKAFFYAWTIKEAVSKAVGQGLQLDFKTLEAGLAQVEKGLDDAAGQTLRAGGFGLCKVFALPAPEDYSAALALRSVG
ncbi:MAG: 4'-phosphopantetheinyl transferase superfamily protein [Burkholderiaceae bacterium]